MDLVVALPTSTHAIFCIIDRFSRVCRIIPYHTSLTVLDVANLFIEHWVSCFGIPKKTISDRKVYF